MIRANLYEDTHSRQDFQGGPEGAIRIHPLRSQPRTSLTSVRAIRGIGGGPISGNRSSDGKSHVTSWKEGCPPTWLAGGRLARARPPACARAGPPKSASGLRGGHQLSTPRCVLPLADGLFEGVVVDEEHRILYLARERTSRARLAAGSRVDTGKKLQLDEIAARAASRRSLPKQARREAGELATPEHPGVRSRRFDRRVLHAFAGEPLHELAVDIDERIVDAAGDPQEPQIRVGFGIEPGKRRFEFGIDPTGAECADPRKSVQMIETGEQSLRSTHGQAGDGARAPVGGDAVRVLDPGNDFA